LLSNDQSDSGRLRRARLLVVVSIASLGTSFQCGFGTGSFNNLVEVVPATFAKEGHAMGLGLWALIVSGFSLGGLVGSVVGRAVLSVGFERKLVLLISNVAVLASAAMLMMGSQWVELFVGRIIVGVVAGFSTSVLPLYFAEVTPPSVRSAIGAAHQVGLGLGVLLSQALATPALSALGSVSTWRYLFLAPVAWALVVLAVLPLLPESPRGILATRGPHEAMCALGRLHGQGSAAAHLEVLRAEVEGPSRASTLLALLTDRSLRKQLRIGAVSLSRLGSHPLCALTLRSPLYAPRPLYASAHFILPPLPPKTPPVVFPRQRSTPPARAPSPTHIALWTPPPQLSGRPSYIYICIHKYIYI